jgi:hypothetical protein
VISRVSVSLIMCTGTYVKFTQAGADRLLPYPRSPTELFSFAAVRAGAQSAVLLRHSGNTLNLK